MLLTSNMLRCCYLKCPSTLVLFRIDFLLLFAFCFLHSKVDQFACFRDSDPSIPCSSWCGSDLGLFLHSCWNTACCPVLFLLLYWLKACWPLLISALIFFIFEHMVRTSPGPRMADWNSSRLEPCDKLLCSGKQRVLHKDRWTDTQETSPPRGRGLAFLSICMHRAAAAPFIWRGLHWESLSIRRLDVPHVAKYSRI